MIVVVHPSGNQNVRALLRAVREAGLLTRFITSLGYPPAALRFLPSGPRQILTRRSYDLSSAQIDTAPLREVVRLLAGRLKLAPLVKHESGWASTDRVWRFTDGRAAAYLRKASPKPRTVYAYEDCAARCFTAAAELGIGRVYDLPVAYWQTAARLLEEEAARYPAWEPTLLGTRDSIAKRERKTQELALAQIVTCPSSFVLQSLPDEIRATKECRVIPFGSPFVTEEESDKHSSSKRPLRVLFAGALTQRKGLADVFRAMELLNSSQIDLIVMGSLLRPLDWYRAQFARFHYEAPRSHPEVLRLMRRCDLLVLPSIVEGRALVQQEAMACGLPVIATENAGATDLIQDGVNGWIVPIRSPERIAQALDLAARDRAALAAMGVAARATARQHSWEHYGDAIVNLLRKIIEHGTE